MDKLESDGHEIQKKGARHHHQTVLEFKGQGGVNEVGDDLRRKWGLTPIFPTATLDALPPSRADLLVVMMGGIEEERDGVEVDF